MRIIHNGSLMTNDPSLKFIADGAVAVDGGRIIAVGNGEAIRQTYCDAELIDAKGGIIMPGLVDTHTHLYRILARGRAEEGALLRSEFELRRGFWQRIEGKLSLDDCIRAAYAAMAQAVHCGVTTMVDMHFCFPDPRASLIAIAGAANDIGIRACLGFGVSASLGNAVFEAAIEENLGFIEYCGARPELAVRALFGFDGLSDIEDSRLWRIAVAVGSRAGYEVSLDGGNAELFDSLRRLGRSPVARLSELGLLGEKTIICHGSGLRSDDLALLKQAGSFVAEAPFSPARSEKIRLDALLRVGVNTSLATDGAFADPVTAAMFALDRLLNSPDIDLACSAYADTGRLLFAGGEFVSRCFGYEIGIIKPEAAADIIIIDVPRYTEPDGNNVHLHLLAGGAKCTFSMINGRIVMLDGILQTANEEFITKRCAAASRALWERAGK